MDRVTSKACNQKISEHHFKATALMVNGKSQFFVFFKGVSPLTMPRISIFCPTIMSYLNYFCFQPSALVSDLNCNLNSAFYIPDNNPDEHVLSQFF